MRDDHRWPGVVAYSLSLQMLLCTIKEGVARDIRSVAIFSNIVVAECFLLWFWSKEVRKNFDLQVQLQLKQHYYTEFFEFFPDSIALYTRNGLSYANKCCVQAFCTDDEGVERLSQE